MNWEHWVRPNPRGLQAYLDLIKARSSRKEHALESLTQHGGRSGIVYLEDQGERSISVLIGSGSTGEGGWPELDMQMKSTTSRAS